MPCSHYHLSQGNLGAGSAMLDEQYLTVRTLRFLTSEIRAFVRNWCSSRFTACFKPRLRSHCRSGTKGEGHTIALTCAWPCCAWRTAGWGRKHLLLGGPDPLCLGCQGKGFQGYLSGKNQVHEEDFWTNIWVSLILQPLDILEGKPIFMHFFQLGTLAALALCFAP